MRSPNPGKMGRGWRAEQDEGPDNFTRESIGRGAGHDIITRENAMTSEADFKRSNRAEMRRHTIFCPIGMEFRQIFHRFSDSFINV